MPETIHNQLGGETSGVDDIASETLRAFVRASADYPAFGTAQATSIALSAIELDIPPDTMLEKLRSQPDNVEKLAAMANSAHQHASNIHAPSVRPRDVQTILWRVFSLAQEMTEQLSSEEIKLPTSFRSGN